MKKIKKVVASTLTLPLAVAVCPIGCQVKAEYPEIFELYYENPETIHGELVKIYNTIKEMNKEIYGLSYDNVTQTEHCPIMCLQMNCFIQQLIRGEIKTSPFKNLYDILCICNYVKNSIDYHNSPNKEHSIVYAPLLSNTDGSHTTGLLETVGIPDFLFPTTNDEFFERLDNEKKSQTTYKKETAKLIEFLKKSLEPFKKFDEKNHQITHEEESTQADILKPFKTLPLKTLYKDESTQADIINIPLETLYVLPDTLGKAIHVVEELILAIQRLSFPNENAGFPALQNSYLLCQLLGSLNEKIYTYNPQNKENVESLLKEMHKIKETISKNPILSAFVEKKPLAINFSLLNSLFDQKGELKEDVKFDEIQLVLNTMLIKLSYSNVSNLNFSPNILDIHFIADLICSELKKNIIEGRTQAEGWFVLDKKKKKDFINAVGELCNNLSSLDENNLSVILQNLNYLNDSYKNNSNNLLLWKKKYFRYDLENLPTEVGKVKAFLVGMAMDLNQVQ